MPAKRVSGIAVVAFAAMGRSYKVAPAAPL